MSLCFLFDIAGIILEFYYIKVKLKKFLSFKLEFSNLEVNKEYGSYNKVQNKITAQYLLNFAY